MMRRAWLGPVFVALLLAPGAQAKLVPTFSERSVRPGELVRLDLGEGAEQFLAPLRVYLLPLAVAGEARTHSDPRLTKLADLGSPGQFDVPGSFEFVVPELEAGEYTAAIWFRGTETRRWANALAGIHPRLTIRQASDLGHVRRTAARGPGAADDQGASLWALLLVGPAALAGLVLWRWLRKHDRRPV